MFPNTSRSDLRFVECREIPQSRKFHEIAHFTQWRHHHHHRHHRYHHNSIVLNSHPHHNSIVLNHHHQHHRRRRHHYHHNSIVFHHNSIVLNHHRHNSIVLFVVVKNNRGFLQLLAHCPIHQCEFLLMTATPQQVHALVQVLYNVLKIGRAHV